MSNMNESNQIPFIYSKLLKNTGLKIFHSRLSHTKLFVWICLIKMTCHEIELEQSVMNRLPIFINTLASSIREHG